MRATRRHLASVDIEGQHTVDPVVWVFTEFELSRIVAIVLLVAS